MYIAVDFDDTITKPSEFPIMGEIKPEAIEVLKKLKKEHTLILWTCREGSYLEEALNALHKFDFEFDYINESPLGGTTRKILVDIYIDDRALGGITDWQKIEELLLNPRINELIRKA